VPVVIEVILERVTNIAMGTEIDAINEFEPLPPAGRCAHGPGRGDAHLTETDQPQERKQIMPRFAANLTMLFTELPFLDRFEAAAKAGFKGVEYLFPYAFDKKELAAACARNGLQAGAAQPAGRRLGQGRARHRLPPRPRGEFAKASAMAIDYATALGCGQLNCLAARCRAGVTPRTSCAAR
jgi:hypothetical protein